MVRRPDHKSYNLKALLTAGGGKKFFHHCLFDLRFIKARLGIEIPSYEVQCTKTLMKIAHPELPAGLGASLREILGVRISKAEQMTDWNVPELTQKQLWYAAGDVTQLHALASRLHSDLQCRQVTIYNKVVRSIATKAYLEVEGYTDLLDYEKEKTEVTIANRNWWRELQARRDTDV